MATVIGPGGVKLAPTSTLAFSTTVDSVNNEVCLSGDIYFSINTTADVTLLFDGDPALSVTDPRDESQTLATFQNISLSPGVYHATLSAVGLTPGEHTITIKAVNAVGKSGEADGTITNKVVEDDNLNAIQTKVQGVNVWDGHLALTSQDFTVPGRGLSLNFTRSYTSAATSSSGPLGAGWTDCYNIQLTHDETCADFTIKGTSGSGSSFNDAGHANPAMASLYNVPAGALFFDADVGTHAILIKPDPGTDAYDFYTPDGIRYHFELEPALAKKLKEVYTARYIQDPTGNRITLYYGHDARASALPANLQAALVDDTPVLDVIVSGGATDGAHQAVYHFSYDIPALAGKPNTTTVTDPRALAVDPTIYTFDNYGATTKIDAPGQTGSRGSNVTLMTWAMDVTNLAGAFTDPKDIPFLLSTTDALNRKTSYSYDAKGNITQTTIALPSNLPAADKFGNPVFTITTKATYDPLFSKATSKTDAEGNTTTYTYATVAAYNGFYGPGDLMKETDPGPSATTYNQYDVYGKALQITDANGNVTSQQPALFL